MITRTIDLNGGYVANAVTLIAFISLFPLLLVVVSIFGLLTGSNPHLADDVVDFLGLTGNAAKTLTDTLDRARESGAAGSIIGVIGMAWSGLSLVGALRYAVNLPERVTVKGIRARVMGIPWLLGAGAILTVSIAISTVLNWVPVWTAPLTLLLSFTIDVALFTWTFWFLDAERPSPRRLLPGAIVAAIGFEVLKTIGTVLLPRLVANSSATYGALGTVFAILAWLLIFSRVFVYSVVVNSVWADDHPTTSAPTGFSGDPAGSDAVEPPQDA
ncbi:MAG TPA: YihY/virulence factor BrkB family protein [Acidimicrobiales bacterium]|nr:YihY/virulence factor BrkB family protein [Acidimicrobiales bacterium]